MADLRGAQGTHAPPPGDLAPPPWEILDPPLFNSSHVLPDLQKAQDEIVEIVRKRKKEFDLKVKNLQNQWVKMGKV